MKSNNTPIKSWPDLIQRVREDSAPVIDLLPGILAALPACRKLPTTAFSHLEAVSSRPAAWAAVTAAFACASALVAAGYANLDDIALQITAIL